MLTKGNQRGDTIVEVSLAFSIFTLLAVGSITIMSRSMAMAQRSLEQTQVRQVMEGQADLLRAAQSTSLWSTQIKTAAVTSAPDIKTSSSFVSSCPSNAPKNSFIIAHDSGSNSLSYIKLDINKFQPAPVTSYIDYSQPKAYGIWVQAVPVPASPAGSPAAYDMYIRSCWDTVDSDVPATLVTIVRLYDKG
jgi:Tfp pilus assembly protein PilW